MRYTVSFLAVVFFFFGFRARASPQLPEYMCYRGDTLPFYELLLEPYLESIGKPTHGSLFGLNFRERASTNCWRGYQALYAIEEGKLFLKGIYGPGEITWRDRIGLDTAAAGEQLRQIFGANVHDGKVLVDWVNGALALPAGKVMRWDGVFRKIFEQGTVCSVRAGRVVTVEVHSNYIDDPKRINRRYNDRPADTILVRLAGLDWRKGDSCHCVEEYSITIGKEGRIKKIRMAAYKESELNEFWEPGEYRFCIRFLQDRLKGLRFDLIRNAGKPMEEEVYLPLHYDDKENRIERGF